MSKRVLWLVVPFIMALSLGMAACAPAAIQNEPITTVSPVTATASQTVKPNLSIAEAAPAKQPQSNAKGALTVSFDPNPVSEGVDWNKGFWIYRVILTETNGVGTTIKNLTVQYCSNDGWVVRSFDYRSKDWFDSWLPGGSLPANGKVITEAGIPVQSTIAYGLFTYNGIDVNGNELKGTGRVDLKH